MTVNKKLYVNKNVVLHDHIFSENNVMSIHFCFYIVLFTRERFYIITFSTKTATSKKKICFHMRFLILDEVFTGFNSKENAGRR